MFHLGRSPHTLDLILSYSSVNQRSYRIASRRRVDSPSVQSLLLSRAIQVQLPVLNLHKLHRFWSDLHGVLRGIPILCLKLNLSCLCLRERIYLRKNSSVFRRSIRFITPTKSLPLTLLLPLCLVHLYHLHSLCQDCTAKVARYLMTDDSWYFYLYLQTDGPSWRLVRINQQLSGSV